MDGDFYVKNKKTGERFKWCKSCHNKRSMANYEAKRTEKLAKMKEKRDADRKADPESFLAKQNAQMKKWREKNAEAAKAIGRRSDAKRRPKKKEYREANKVRIQAKKAEYRRANKARIDAQNAEYRRRNTEILRQRQKDWGIAHPEAYREMRRRWKRENKEAVNRSTHRRRYALANSPGFYLPEEWMALKALCDFRCLACGKSETDLGEVLAVDHIVPVSKGGGNTIVNIEPLCRSCNSVKHTSVHDFRPNWIRAVVESGALLTGSIEA